MILNELFQHFFLDFKGKYLKEKKRKGQYIESQWGLIFFGPIFVLYVQKLLKQ